MGYLHGGYEMIETNNIDIINTRIKRYNLAIFCGYDNVGKNHIMDIIAKKYKYNIFNPDYNFINKFLPVNEMWSFFMYFLMIYKSMDNPKVDSPLLISRDVLCGAVYNNDETIMKEYSEIINKINHIHILIKCSKESYINLLKVRNPRITYFKILNEYENYLKYTERYENYLNKYNLPYIVFNNEYNEITGEHNKKICGGCDYFKENKCINEIINTKNGTKVMGVEYTTPRCYLFK